MNLIIIGNETDEIAMDIWRGNTNYMVLNKSPYIWSKNYADFVKDKAVIVSTTSEQFENRTINDTIEILKSRNFIPILISDKEDDMPSLMYSVLKDENLNTLWYMKNKKKIDYDELIKTAQGYLLGKGLYDNAIRTPRKRKKSTTEE